MDGIENQQPEIQQSKDQKVVKIILISIIVIFVLASLYYLNLFPFKPAKPANTTTKVAKEITPAIAPVVSTQQAKKVLISALPNIFVSALTPDPSQIIINQDRNISETFISSWNIKESTVSAIFAITDDKGIFQLYLSFRRPQNVPPSVKLASATTSELFSVKAKGEWGCKPLYNNTMTYCENFWEEPDGTRKGLGMKGLFTQGPNLIKGQSDAVIVFCEHRKDSKLYSWKSCEFELAKTGVLTNP